MSDTHGSIRPPPALPDAQMHLFHAANAENRHVAAFWAQYDLALRAGAGGSTRVGVERNESMYR